jgi:small subunit ribosomal protein S4
MRKIRKKFKRPQKPWDSRRIEEEKGLMREYGLRNKRELWRSQEILRQFRRRARELIAVEDPAKKKSLLDRLVKIGMLSKEAGLDDVLALEIRSLLDRRLQSLVAKRKLAESPLHARQMITHGHVMVAGRRTKYPSYIVPSEMESKIFIKGGNA